MAVETSTIRRPADRLERAAALDRLADPTRSFVRRALTGRLRDFLNGVWLGHPLHPALVQVPLGAWASASVLDAMCEMDGSATALVGLGTVSALPAATAGWADWSNLGPNERRVGLVHAAINISAVGLQAASLVARLTGHRRRGRMLSLSALALSSSSAYLGGHMTYRQAASVNEAAPKLHALSAGWHRVGSYADVPHDSTVVREVDGISILLFREGDTVTAMLAECAHLGGPLGEGEITRIGGHACVVCPWHGSTYRLAGGMVVRGPSATDQPSLRLRVVDGAIEVAGP